MPISTRATNLPGIQHVNLGPRRVPHARVSNLAGSIPKVSLVVQASANISRMARANTRVRMPRVSAPRLDITV